MAWRPNENLIEGELDNTVPGKVTGWMRFLGMDEPVRFQLEGDFHRDIRGGKIRLRNSGPLDRSQSGPVPEAESRSYMKGFSPVQTGKAGDITAGLPPQDYSSYPYIEWYSGQNGRVVLELEPGQVEVTGQPLPWRTAEPVSRARQADSMADFLSGLGGDMAQINAAGGIGTEDAPRPVPSQGTRGEDHAEA